jgi:hypothetical protein
MGRLLTAGKKEKTSSTCAEASGEATCENSGDAPHHFSNNNISNNDSSGIRRRSVDPADDLVMRNERRFQRQSLLQRNVQISADQLAVIAMDDEEQQQAAMRDEDAKSSIEEIQKESFAMDDHVDTTIASIDILLSRMSSVTSLTIHL